MIVSFMAIGAAVISPFAGQLMKRIGRKLGLIVFVVPGAIGWICITFATSIIWLYIGRLLIGFSGGAFTVIIPVYVGEISQPSIRGKLSAYFTILINLGTVYAYVTGYLLNMFWMNFVCGSVTLVHLICLFFVPESPRYDVSRTRLSKAKQSLRFLRGNEYDVDSEVHSILEAQTEINSEEKENGIKLILTNSVHRKAFIIVIGLIFAFQMSGINAVLFYTNEILQGANVNLDSGIATIIVGVIFFISAALSSILVDKLGRRILMLISTACLIVCFGLMGTYFLIQKSGVNVDAIAWAPVLILSVFVSIHALGIGPITWIVLGEVLDQSVKDVAVGFSITWSYSLSIVVSLLFPFLSGTVGDGWTFIIFGSFSVISFVFIYFMVPETKGKSLEQIQDMLRKQK